MQLACMLCHTVTKGEKTMHKHLMKYHAETVAYQYNIVQNFSCEEDSVAWKKFIVPTLLASNHKDESGAGKE